MTGTYTTGSARPALFEMSNPQSKVSVRDGAALWNAVQCHRMTKTRLGIPALFQGELLHGFMFHGATSFPQALALASAWDPALVGEVFAAGAGEMASAGVNQAFTPVLEPGEFEAMVGPNSAATSKATLAAVAK